MKKRNLSRTKIIQIAIFVALFLLIAVLAVDFFLSNSNDKKFQRGDFAMNTYISQTLYGQNSEEVARLISDETLFLDQSLLSKTSPSSDIYKLNRSGGNPVQVSERSAEYLQLCLKAAEASEGAFNPFLGALTDQWGFGSENPKVPDKEVISGLLESLENASIEFSGENTVIFDSEAAQIDLGAVGKGIACDEAKRLLDNSKSVSGAVVAAGGSVLTWGQKPNSEPWTVSVRNPFSENQSDVIGDLRIEGTAFISTSGSYERYFVENEKEYHHILDPKSGYPADNELISVTVLAKTGIDSDMLSTACFVLGYDKSENLLNQYSSQAVFVYKNGDIRFSGDTIEAMFSKK